MDNNLIFNKITTNWESMMEKMKVAFEINEVVHETFMSITKLKKFEKNTLYIELPAEGYISYFEKTYSFPIKSILVQEIEELSFDSFNIKFSSPANVVNKNTTLTQESFEKILKKSGIGVKSFNNTFENFVQGPSNSLAYTSCIAVAEEAEKNYNPLFIYGGTGLGKTHLLQAIAIFALNKNPNLNVLYTSGDAFMTDFVNSVQKKTMQIFREKYRNLDIFIIDDIQSISGAKETQEALFNIFNELYDNNKRIVFSSDKSPKELDGVEERLISRFSWGMTCDITMPNYETRIAILRKKIENIKPEFPVDEEVIKYIARNVKSNIRELESSLSRIIMASKLKMRAIDLALAKEILKDYKNEEKKITPDLIIDKVSEYLGIESLDICGKKRKREFVYARDLAIYLCREQIKDITQEKIGFYFGGRDHSTVINSYKKIDDNLRNGDKELEKVLNDLRKRIKE